MVKYEYMVLAAPTKGLRAKGVKGAEARFANALMTVMNEMGAEGWEYQRSDTLPCEERHGLTGKSTRFQNMLVFRRPLDDSAASEKSVTTAVERPVLAAQTAANRDGATPVRHVPAPSIQAEQVGAAPAIGPATQDSEAAEVAAQ